MSHGRPLLLAGSVLLLLAAAIALIPGVGPGRAWAPGGPDAPEPPLSAFLVLWIAASVGFIFEALRQDAGTQAIAEVRVRMFSAALAAAAVFVLLTDLLGIVLLSFILLIPVQLLAMRSARKGQRLDAPDRQPAGDAAAPGPILLAAAALLSASACSPSLVRQIAGLGPSDHPWLSFWVFAAHAALPAWLFARRWGANRWCVLALLWGAAAAMVHNWAVSGLHAIALMSGALTLWLLLVVTRRPKQLKSAA